MLYLNLCNRVKEWRDKGKESSKNGKEQNILIFASPYILAAMAGALFLVVKLGAGLCFQSAFRFS